MPQQNFGVIGLAVMGENLALNVEENGYSISVFNRNPDRTKAFMADPKKALGKNVYAAYTIEDFVASLERPRKILIMVKAGEPVDGMIQQLKPLLDADDILIDGGNSLYTDTARRATELESAAFTYIGMGVSGGEEGARFGPSLMPGGTPKAYESLSDILIAISAKAEDDKHPCVTYIGPGGAGHYVKMVHNGIEYGDMQLIAEAYDLLKNALGLTHTELHEVFDEWNKTPELESFLIKITADIFQQIDPKTGLPLVDVILDAAGQKGTGQWTVTSALELAVPIPTMIAAVTARHMSALKDQRLKASQQLTGSATQTFEGDRQAFIQKIRDALYCSKMCSYAQGMALLSKASQTFEFNLNLGDIARIWKGGCIIRAGFLNKIKQAFDQDPALPNLLLAPEFKQTILDKQAAWREVIMTSAQLGIAVPAFSASLDYFDSYRRDRLPQNLTQAQRDLFGAHTYKRIDQDGDFHTEWGS